MSGVEPARPHEVMGPHGEMLTIATLPSRTISRWVPARKAQVVYAVNGGLLSLDEALVRYSISLEEFIGWRRSIEQAGLHGLRVTQAQFYRSKRAKNS
ncbi:DUF1153 domain-containing protein [Altererythrobacter xixiisoli]|uniref:DUF1153 domain-containing protein n=1 Tax=Croceibacterium xixiisoli TaxID=1476466 RepID=A0A6I4TP96_9SPHN|nr:DUF1153 domain-containing protein [Croceibacterium xixiisoli]MXO97905.1 DUF1153 domain-containing protein [Croceibacterium xixiisoli]